jgi:hypothetical protein
VETKDIKFFLENSGYVPVIITIKHEQRVIVGRTEAKIESNPTNWGFNLDRNFFDLSIDEISDIMDEKIDETLQCLMELLRESIEEQVTEQIALALAPIMDYSRANPEKEKPTEVIPAGEQGAFTKALAEEMSKLGKAIQEQFNQASPLFDSFTNHSEHVHFTGDPTKEAVPIKHYGTTPFVHTSPYVPNNTIGIIAGLPYEPFVNGEPEEDSGTSPVGHTHSGFWFPHSICGEYCSLFTSVEGKTLTKKLPEYLNPPEIPEWVKKGLGWD